MKVLRLELFQETACYKKPFAFKVSETYPLPPHSTVKGMIHALLKANELIPMKISIQGTYDTLLTDYQTHYFFKKDKTNEFVLTADGLGLDLERQDITSMPIYMHMLLNVKLLIHVQAEEEILEQIHKALETGTTHLSLGRWEDLVRVDQCKMVDVEESEDEYTLDYDAYVPEQYLEDGVNYFPYKLNWTYRIIQGVRVWDKLNVGYVKKGEPFYAEDGILVDSEGDVLLFPN
jgi:CRISPR-associated protein Cas5t